MRRLLLALLLLTVALPALAADKSVRFVTFSGTRLLEKASAFSKTLAKLDAGAKVTVQKAKGSYLLVSWGGQTGWIASRAVQAKTPKIGSSTSASSDASAEEVAAATKGFNSDVEAKYSKDNPKLDYKQLDRLETRTLVADPVDGLKAFRKTGKLGEFSGGADE